MWLEDRETGIQGYTEADAILPSPVPGEPGSILPRLMGTTRVGLPAPPQEAKQAKAAGAVKALKETKPAPAEEITREPKQDKALRAEKALKSITPVAKPENQEPAPTAETEEQRRERLVFELYPNTALSVTEIARRIGMPQPYVSQYAKRLGMPLRLRPQDQKRVRDEAEEVPEGTEADVAEQEEDDLPQASSATAPQNGHVFTLHGVSLTHDAISFNGKEMPITESHYRLLHALLRAAPHPIGVPHLLSKVYPGKAKTEAEVVFGIVVKDVERNLPHVDLGLKVMKGIGVALTGSDAG